MYRVFTCWSHLMKYFEVSAFGSSSMAGMIFFVQSIVDNKLPSEMPCLFTCFWFNVVSWLYLVLLYVSARCKFLLTKDSRTQVAHFHIDKCYFWFFPTFFLFSALLVWQKLFSKLICPFTMPVSIYDLYTWHECQLPPRTRGGWHEIFSNSRKDWATSWYLFGLHIYLSREIYE